MFHRKFPKKASLPVTTVVVRERFRPSCMGVINLRYHVDHLAAKAFFGCHLDRGVLCYGLSQLSSPEDQRRLAPKLVGFLFILNQNINPISLDLGTSIFRNPPSKSGDEHTR